jgi:multiple sugar transport system permease protein
MPRGHFGLRYRQWVGLLLISPWLVGVIFFKVLPILGSFALSFTNFHLLRAEQTRFVGLENYVRVLGDWGAGYTLFATLGVALLIVPIQLAASLGLAALLCSPRLKARTTLRTLFFLPSIIPSVAIAFMWFGFVDPSTGWLNRLILEPLGLVGFTGAFTEGAFNMLIAIVSLWSIGPGFLIMVGVMQSLPPEIHEAARVDGAGPLTRFFSITLPLISPAIFFALVINLISVFGGVILMDRGSVFSGGAFSIGGISPLDDYVYYMMFTRMELGYASSLAWLFFVLALSVIAVLFTTSKRWVYFPDHEQ